MSDSRSLLTRIAALRQRLDSLQAGMGVSIPKPETPPPTETAADPAARLQHLVAQVAAGVRQDQAVDAALRPLTRLHTSDETPLPRVLTARARWLLDKGRQLLEHLRRLGDDPLLRQHADDPLEARYRATAAMANSALRMVLTFPDSPSAQIKLCEGLEAILEVVAERIGSLRHVVDRRRQQTVRVETLAEFLARLNAEEPVDIHGLVVLAETLVEEVHQAAPLRFYTESPQQPARFIAGHSLNVAQVIARLARQDPDYRGRHIEPVLAALLHDAGMVRVAADMLTRAGPFEDQQQRRLEQHTRIGAELIAHLLPDYPDLASAALGHHERLDGTGYPSGLMQAQLAPLTRLLAVCDVYAALCAPRPHRAAFDPRTALTDTLLLAENGKLDPTYAERLLLLSFYPVGSLVELADGAVAVVVATHMGRRDLSAPARPVVLVLTDEHGRPLAVPQALDLAQCDGRTVVRTLPPAEARAILGERHPELG